MAWEPKGLPSVGCAAVEMRERFYNHAYHGATYYSLPGRCMRYPYDQKTALNCCEEWETLPWSPRNERLARTAQEFPTASNESEYIWARGLYDHLGRWIAAADDSTRPRRARHLDIAPRPSADATQPESEPTQQGESSETLPAEAMQRSPPAPPPPPPPPPVRVCRKMDMGGECRRAQDVGKGKCVWHAEPAG